jgi:hypothetical protein
MEAPPSEAGADHVSATWLLPAVPTTDVGAPGTDPITTVEAVALVTVLPSVSITAPDARVSTTVPVDAHTTVTVIDTPNELERETVQPVAVPVTEKSSALTPDTRSEKVTTYESVVDSDGDVGEVNCAVGDVGSKSMVVVGATPETPGVSGETVLIPSLIHRPRVCEMANGGCDVANRSS